MNAKELVEDIRSYEIETLLEFVTPLMDDPEREVHQGTGWFLREAWKVQRQKVEAFLL